MAIKYQMHSEGMFPRVFCDSCGKAMTVKEGNVFWNDQGEIVFGHFGDCCRKLDTGNWPCSNRFDFFLVDLLNNIKATPKLLKGAAELSDRFGFGVVTDRKKLR